ncbi:hypothetical protein G3578_01540 [Brevibacillus sp. SYP-B805]|uniref:hypothetical protein n=1 Tax=Brevibacillus sp. SYP-B805 TaxID=1578199 RepID=UPI0013ED3EA1|nr:hypothetical protein [Brevibacillus sp. SYP-B805]NGQ93853.1 hypothetical protein [Brevibacillus sp. SYP-B805]
MMEDLLFMQIDDLSPLFYLLTGLVGACLYLVPAKPPAVFTTCAAAGQLRVPCSDGLLLETYPIGVIPRRRSVLGRRMKIANTDQEEPFLPLS